MPARPCRHAGIISALYHRPHGPAPGTRRKPPKPVTGLKTEANYAIVDNLLKQFAQSSQLGGGNASFIEDLYEQYLVSPDSVGPKWKAYFDGFKGREAGDVPHSAVIAHIAEAGRQAAHAGESGADPASGGFALLGVVGGQAGTGFAGGVHARDLTGQVLIPRPGGDLRDGCSRRGG